MNTIDPTCMDDYDPDALDIKSAQQKILQSISAIEHTERLALRDVIGRVTAEDIIAPIDVPGFRNSAMDGYAFVHASATSNTTLSIAGISLAGHPYTGEMADNQCVKVMTGALVPTQADTVIMQENTTAHADRVQIGSLPAMGANIRAAGSNIKASSILIRRNRRLGPAELGLIASVGFSEVTVLRKLRVACFSTGDELAAPGQTLGPGMIHDSNRYMLLGLLNDASIEIVDMGIQKDNADALRACLREITHTDMAISSGGVSVGEADFVKQVLAEFGEVNFWKIAMKPGRPLMHATLKSGTQFFGLPGNPVSGIVTFHHFVKPAIEAMLGQPVRPPLTQSAVLKDRLTKQPGRVEMQRGVLDQDSTGQWQVNSTGAQDSHVLTSMHRANCYIVLDLESAGAEYGDRVNTVPFINFQPA